MFSLHLLGPVSLSRHDQLLPLPTHKAQALLLLVALGGPSHRARLAAWLWPLADDSAGRRNLRRELARLRDAGAGEALLSQGEVLSLSPAVQCDAQAFAALADGNRAAEALALWRGPLADGLQTGATEAFDDWLAHERQRLAGRRRQLLAAEAAAAEAAGNLPRALDTVQQLLADDLLQEHLHRQAMRLHAAAGDRSAALAQHARCRDALVRELGLAPSAETEALAERIRAGLGVASTPVAAPPTAAAPAAQAGGAAWPAELPLTGRDAAWQTLHTAWQAQQLAVIEGEAGVGKTRLARDFAASRGAYALVQCRRSDAGVPYASFTRLLRGLAGQSLPQAGLPDWVRLELAHVLPELGAGPRRIGSAEEQRRFCEACATAWQLLTSGNFDTVVLDDWHLADDASRALMGFIAEQRREGIVASPVREIQVQRPEWPSAAAAARQRALLRAAGACLLPLAPLDGDGVYALVKRLSGADDPRRFAQRLERATGGNPFFLGETLRQWRGLGLLGLGPDGVWQTPFDAATQDYAELPVPDSVRDTVIARVQRQPEAVRRVLEAACLASEPFTAGLLAGACALSEVEALDAIDAAVAAQLLRPRDGGFAFVHDLVQAALESALGPERARLVHRRLALGGEAAGQDSADIARHWEAGGEPTRAVSHRLAAAEAALALHADAEAQTHWQAALDDQPTLAQRVRILGQRWQMLAHRGDQPGLLAAVQALDAARDEARATTAPGAEALALEAEVHAAEILAHSQRNDDALARIQACLAHPGLGPVARAQALRVQSQVLSRLGRTDEARAATEAALAAGGLTPLQQGDLLHALSYTHFLAGAPQASLDQARRALAVWQTTGARRQMAQAQASIGRALDMLDERDAAWAALEEAFTQAAALRMVDLQRVVANNLANNRINHGGPARAIQVIREAQALAPHFTMPGMPVFYLGILVQAHAQLGELGTALDLADEALDRAIALDETLTLADCLLMTLGLRSALGDAAGIRRLLAAMAGRSLAGLGYFGAKVALELAGHALRQGQRDAARTHLAAVGDVAALRIPPDRAAARAGLAQLALADGDAQGALDWLAPLAGQVLYTEVQAQCCRLRLAAGLQLGRPDPVALAEADQALAASDQGRTLPALARLALLRTRGAVARQVDDGAGAARCADAAAQLQARLAGSLGRWQALAPALDAS